MVCHWTGIYWNGLEHGLKVFQEVERRLRARFAEQMLWMKLSEVARYWAARELTAIEADGGGVRLQAPFACPDFTLRCPGQPDRRPALESGGGVVPLREIRAARDLVSGTCLREADGHWTVCVDLAKGRSQVVFDQG
jgi:hypothetical protein